MADIAELGFQIDSSSVTKAKGELDKLATSADNVQKSSRSLAQYAIGTGQSLQTQAQMFGTAGRGMVTAIQQVEEKSRGSATGMDVLYSAINRVVGVTGGMAQGVGNAATRFSEMSTAAQQASLQGGVLKSVMEEIGVSVGAVVGIVTGLAAAFAASLSFKSFLDNTIEAEQVTSKLNTALISTKGAAGQSMESLAGLAEEMSKSTTFSTDNVKAAEGMLLMYTRISGDTFPTAMKAAADLAARMGTDLPNATRTLGRALQEPATSMDSLRRMGVVLSQTQEDQIKHFVAVNDAAGAQKVILDAVNKSAGGTAEAMRNTLGGAISVLKNTWNDLFSLGGKPVDSLRTAIDGLTVAISDPSFKAFIQTIGDLLFSSMTRTVGMVTSLVKAVGDLVRNMASAAPIIATVAVGLATAFAPAIIEAALTLAGAFIAMAASAALLLGPIGLIALGIAALAVGAVYFRDQIKKIFGIDIAEIFKSTFNFIVNAGELVWETMKIRMQELPDVATAISISIQNAFIDAWNGIKIGWNDFEKIFSSSIERLKSTLSDWIETAKGYIASLVKQAMAMIPDGLKKFMGWDTSGSAAGGVVTGAVPKTLEGTIPAPGNLPPPVTSGDFGPALTPNIPNAAAAQLDANNAKLDALRKKIMSQDPAGEVLKSIRDALKTSGEAADKATPKFNGAADALGKMRNPGGAGKEDPFQKILTGAQEYIDKQNALAQSYGVTGIAALTLTHEQDLLNKAVQAHITLTAPQIEQLHQVAVAMAEAQQAANTAKFIKQTNMDSDKFIADQKLQAAAVFQSAQAADQARIAQDLLNKARQEGADVSNPALLATIQQVSQAEAAAAQATRDMKEWGDLAKTSFTGFFTDMFQNLQQGKSFWDSLGQAAMNALNNIANKLIQMAASKLMDQAFNTSGGGGGSGGFLGTILGAIGLGGGGQAGGFTALSPSATMNAYAAAPASFILP
jgi:hypothetical protein